MISRARLVPSQRLTAAACKMEARRQKVLTHGREEIDHLGILRKIGFVLNTAWDHRNIAGLHCSLLVTNAKIHCAFDHPHKLLMRMRVSGGTRTSLYAPVDHCALFAGYDTAPDFIGNLLLRH